MRRRHRIEPPGGIQHVMNRGVDRATVFFADVDRVEFGRLLADIHERFGVETLAYCLMGNHYHLLLRAPAGSLSPSMQRLSSVYTRHTNDRLGRDGPLFRGRFHAIPVTTDAYLLTAARYIHRNPIDMAGVDDVRRYRWSSLRSYLGFRRPAPFLETSTISEMFGSDIDRIAEFTAPFDRSSALCDIRRIDVDTLRQLILLAIADDDLRFGEDERSSQHSEATIATLLEHDATNPALTKLAGSVNDHPTPAARRAALYRARHRVRGDLALQRIIAALPDRLGTTDLAA